jgi:membrane protease YdiL (CAAX protease family)
MWFAAGTLVVMGGVGMALIPTARNTGSLDFVAKGLDWYYQMTIGLVFGVVTAKAGWGLIQIPYLREIRNFFIGIFKPLRLSLMEIAFISFCAGVGEELLFRAAIQPFLGIWFTAFLFVLLHGYLNPFNAPMMVYGVYMTVVIGVMGYFTEFFGIITAMAAHFAIDMYLLYELSVAEGSETVGEEDDTESGDQDNS